MNITVIGAGKMGGGLAKRFAMAGHEVTIGSFDPALAEEAAQQAREKTGCANIFAAENREAVSRAELVVVVIPSAGHRELLESLKDSLREKILVDVTIPMAFGPLRYAPPPEGSNAQEAYAVLGEGSRVTAGFHTVSSALLNKVDTPLSGSTFVVGSDDESAQTVVELARSLGLNAIHAGGLQFAHTVESLTPMLLGINKRYGSNCAGIDITGV